jgi:hypothetical protein
MKKALCAAAVTVGALLMTAAPALALTYSGAESATLAFAKEVVMSYGAGHDTTFTGCAGPYGNTRGVTQWTCDGYYITWGGAYENWYVSVDPYGEVLSYNIPDPGR